MFKTVMRYESMKRHFLLFVRVISTLTALYIVLGEGKKNRSRQKGIHFLMSETNSLPTSEMNSLPTWVDNTEWNKKLKWVQDKVQS